MCLRLAEVKLSRQLVVRHICVGIYLSEIITPTIITQAFSLEMFSQVKHFKKPDHLYKERKLTTDPKVVSVPFCLLAEVGRFNIRARITFEASSGLHQVHFLALPRWLHFSAPEVAAWRRQAEHPRCSDTSYSFLFVS